MNHRADRGRYSRPMASGAGWHYGFDEPGLVDGTDGFRLRREDRFDVATWRDGVHGARPPRGENRSTTFAGRAATGSSRAGG